MKTDVRVVQSDSIGTEVGVIRSVHRIDEVRGPSQVGSVRQMEEKFRQVGIVIVSRGPIGGGWGSTGNKAVNGWGKVRGTAGEVAIGEKLRCEGRSH